MISISWPPPIPPPVAHRADIDFLAVFPQFSDSEIRNRPKPTMQMIPIATIPRHSTNGYFTGRKFDPVSETVFVFET
jgi:hypothetical protein